MRIKPAPVQSHALAFTLRSAGKANMLGAVRRDIVVMAALATLSRAAVVCLAVAGAGARAAEVDSHAATVKPTCLNAADTREQVKAHKLIEPFAALKSAAQQRKAEALSAKLCVSGDDYVYEITLLNRDGRLIHVQMEAATGKLIARPAHETHEPHEAHEPAHDTHDTPPVKN
jgi:uncharacterized membrane protein YkoI